MSESKTRSVIYGLLLLFITAFFLSACSTDEIADTFGSCCGVAPLPIAAVGWVIASQWKKKR